MKPLIITLATLVFLGAGCYQTADQLSTEAVSPLTTSAAALKTAKDTMAGVKLAESNEMAQATDPITVAYTILDGHPVPPQAEVGETFGCSDRLGFLAVPRAVESGNELQDAVVTMLASRETSVSDMYNVLGNSRLVLDHLTVKDGVTEIYLKGQPVSGGTCDDPRIKHQVEGTIKRYATKYKLFLNGKESAWRCLGNLKGDCK